MVSSESLLQRLRRLFVVPPEIPASVIKLYDDGYCDFVKGMGQWLASHNNYLDGPDGTMLFSFPHSAITKLLVVSALDRLLGEARFGVLSDDAYTFFAYFADFMDVDFALATWPEDLLADFSVEELCLVAECLSEMAGWEVFAARSAALRSGSELFKSRAGASE